MRLSGFDVSGKELTDALSKFEKLKRLELGNCIGMHGGNFHIFASTNVSLESLRLGCNVMVESITDAAFDEYAEIRLTDMLDAACCFKNLRTLWIDSHLSAVAGEREDFEKNISRRKKLTFLYIGFRMTTKALEQLLTISGLQTLCLGHLARIPLKRAASIYEGSTETKAEMYALATDAKADCRSMRYYRDENGKTISEKSTYPPPDDEYHGYL